MRLDEVVVAAQELEHALHEQRLARAGHRPFELAGTADLSLIRAPQAVAVYCAKYVAKGGAMDLFGIDGSAAGQSAGP